MSSEPPFLRRIAVKDFRSLADVDVQFGAFSVLVGPNGSGKSNLLHVLRFVADSAREDLSVALHHHGGFERLHRSAPDAGPMSLLLEAAVTEHASDTALDSYTLELFPPIRTLFDGMTSLDRRESFLHKRNAGQGRRKGFQTSGRELLEAGEDDSGQPSITATSESLLGLSDAETSGLAATRMIESKDIGSGPRQFVDFLSEIYYLDPQVDLAREPARRTEDGIDAKGSNLASALLNLKERDSDAFAALVRDMRACLPGLTDITTDVIGGAAAQVVVRLREAGISRPVDLADASFGTVRLLTILTALHEPDPPRLLIIEEVDHGLHPYALDVMAGRMRAASARMQIIAASHSPTFVNHLEAEELIICDRDPETGESEIPVLTTEELRTVLEASEMRPGELWYAGALDGVPRDE